MYKAPIFILVFILLMCSSCYHVDKTVIAKNPHTEKKIDKIYVVKVDKKSTGYAYNFKWENEYGVVRNHYLVYDSVGKLIGFIGDDGKTVKYNDHSKDEMGNFELDIALERIFDTNNISYNIISDKNVDVATTQKKVIREVKNDRINRNQEDEYEDEYKDETYEDETYEDETYEDETYENKDESYEDESYQDESFEDQF